MSGMVKPDQKLHAWKIISPKGKGTECCLDKMTMHIFMLIHTDKCSTREASPYREWWCMKIVTAVQGALVLIPKTRHLHHPSKVQRTLQKGGGKK